MQAPTDPKSLFDDFIAEIESTGNTVVGDWEFVGKPLGSGAGTFMATPESSLPYFVMDYVEGDSLSKILESIRGGKVPPLQPALFKNLALITLRALLSAHQGKVLHLDIKPGNIMFSSRQSR